MATWFPTVAPGTELPRAFAGFAAKRSFVVVKRDPALCDGNEFAPLRSYCGWKELLLGKVGLDAYWGAVVVAAGCDCRSVFEKRDVPSVGVAEPIPDPPTTAERAGVAFCGPSSGGGVGCVPGCASCVPPNCDGGCSRGAVLRGLGALTVPMS